jgi:hypothetical protein
MTCNTTCFANARAAARTIAPAAALLLLAIAGCTDAPAATLLPGANLDPLGGALGSELARSAEQPCGYEFVNDLNQPGYSYQDREHAVITYNSAGLDILEEGVYDDSNAFSFRYTTEYTAMGNPLHFVAEFDGDYRTDMLYVYDSFGRLIQSTVDNDGEDADSVYTYGYGDDGLRRSAHVVLPTVTYDRTYHYDDNARVVQVDRDNGPDGTIDEITRFEYNDAGRVTSRTITDSAGTVIGTGAATYDRGNRVISRIDTRMTIEGLWRHTSDYAYSGQRLDTLVDIDRITDSAGQVVADSQTRYVWHYGRCR